MLDEEGMIHVDGILDAFETVKLIRTVSELMRIRIEHEVGLKTTNLSRSEQGLALHFSYDGELPDNEITVASSDSRGSERRKTHLTLRPTEPGSMLEEFRTKYDQPLPQGSLEFRTSARLLG